VRLKEIHEMADYLETSLNELGNAKMECMKQSADESDAI